METDLQDIWKSYKLDELQSGLDSLFPEYKLSVMEIWEKVLSGDIIGVIGEIFLSGAEGVLQQLSGYKNLFVWLLLLGITASLLTQFTEVFNKHQVAELGYYFMYLLLSAVLFKCFLYVAQVGGQLLDNIIMFVSMAMPAFLLSVGVTTGTTTVGAYSLLFVWIIYGVQQILGKGVYKLITIYVVLTLLNGIWIEERLFLLVELIKKIINLILKAALGVVTGISIFQTLITPVIDSAKSSALQGALSAIPGIGDASEGVFGMVLGSAVIIKNSIGVVLLILLLVICTIPIMQIFVMAWLLRLVAAVMGIVSDKRLVDCTNKMGESCMLMCRTATTGAALFFIVISVLALATNRGF